MIERLKQQSALVLNCQENHQAGTGDSPRDMAIYSHRYQQHVFSTTKVQETRSQNQKSVQGTSTKNQIIKGGFAKNKSIRSLLFLINAIFASSLWLEAHFQYADRCQSVPVSMCVYQTRDATSLLPLANETVGYYYSLMRKSGRLLPPYDRCGHSTIVDDNCCVNEVYQFGVAATVSKVRTGLIINLPETQDNSRYPVMANDQVYCNLKSTDDFSLAGFKEIYVRKMGECVSGYFTQYPGMICHLNGTFSLFSSQNCTSILSKVEMNDNQKIFSDPHLGNFSAVLVRVSRGSQVPSWMTYQPEEFEASGNSMTDPIIMICLFLYFADLLGMLGQILFTINKIPKTNRMVRLLILISQILCSMWLVIRFIDDYSIYTRKYSVLVSAIQKSILNLYTFVTCLFPLFFACSIAGLGMKMKASLIIVLAIIHLLLAGAKYSEFLLLFPSIVDQSAYFASFQWVYREFLFETWIFLCFIIDLIPFNCILNNSLMQLDIAYQIATLSQVPNFYRYMNKRDPLFFPLNFSQITIISIYYWSKFLMYGTNFIRDDRTLRTFPSVEIFCHIFHNILVSIMLERFKQV